jgi:hypothetical protein
VTRAEYQERALSALRRVRELEVTGYKIAAALLGIVLVWTWVFELGSRSGWQGGVALLLCSAAIFFWIFWNSFLWKPVSREFDLICPACGASLLRPPIVRITVIETLRSGKCQRCGAEVLTGEEPPPRALSTAPTRRLSPVLGAVLALALLVIFIASRQKYNNDFCASRYAAALTAADTADVDDEDLPLASSQRHVPTCRILRR